MIFSSRKFLNTKSKYIFSTVTIQRQQSLTPYHNFLLDNLLTAESSTPNQYITQTSIHS